VRKASNIHVNKKRVARLMKEAKLFGIGTYKRKPTYKAGSIHKAHPNHLKQCFITKKPNESWVSSSVRGKSRISKSGSKICRGALFMPVMVATQRNEKLKRFYNRLKDNGKHTTVAQIAVMRKLLIIVHSLYKKNEVYDPIRI
jgi:hypothetical protein